MAKQYNFKMVHEDGRVDFRAYCCIKCPRYDSCTKDIKLSCPDFINETGDSSNGKDINLSSSDQQKVMDLLNNGKGSVEVDGIKFTALGVVK